MRDGARCRPSSESIRRRGYYDEHMFAQPEEVLVQDQPVEPPAETAELESLALERIEDEIAELAAHIYSRRTPTRSSGWPSPASSPATTGDRVATDPGRRACRRGDARESRARALRARRRGGGRTGDCPAPRVRLLAGIDRRGGGLAVIGGAKASHDPPALRRALRARDRTCRFPGCENTRFVDAHHLLHWAMGGETSLDNLLLVCRHHHRLMHERGFTVEGRPDGQIRFWRPDGRAIERVPPASRGDPESCAAKRPRPQGHDQF
jgi:hypothetical protein